MKNCTLLHITHYTLLHITTHYTLYIIHCTLHIAHYTLHFVYSIHYTLYIIHYTLYIVHYTFYIMHYALCILHIHIHIHIHIIIISLYTFYRINGPVHQSQIPTASATGRSQQRMHHHLPISCLADGANSATSHPMISPPTAAGLNGRQHSHHRIQPRHGPNAQHNCWMVPV